MARWPILTFKLYVPMQILLAEAKTMRPSASLFALTVPIFQADAQQIAAEIAQMDVEAIAREFRCSLAIAQRVHDAYRHFSESEPSSALMAYDGHAYKHLHAGSLDDGALVFAGEHLWVTSFLYGLLRPSDGVVPYRMEASLRLDMAGEASLSHFWQPRLTRFLIDRVREDDGVLLHLSTAEFTHLFDWAQVKREVRVVEPHFCVRKDGILRVQAVWAKACRGAMLRFVLENRLADPSALVAFEYEGFRYHPESSDALHPCFIREA